MVIANPQDLNALDQLRFRSGCDIVPRFGFKTEILDGIAKVYQRPSANPGPKTQPKAAAMVRSSSELMHDIKTLGTEVADISFESVKLGLTGSGSRPWK